MSDNPVKIIEPIRFEDTRGWFTEVYNKSVFDARGIQTAFVQDNHSLSLYCHTLRGLHFQMPPYGQAKLVRCTRGSIFDVAVDLRSGSPSYGNWVGTQLTALNGRQLFIPVGFAHGFLTLEPLCEVMYKCSEIYEPSCDRGLRWDDPTLDIDWPIAAGHSPELSIKDASLPMLAAFASPFPYDGRPLTPID